MNKSHFLVIIFGDHILMFNYKSGTSYAKLVVFCDKHVENAYVNHVNDFVKKLVAVVYLSRRVVMI